MPWPSPWDAGGAAGVAPPVRRAPRSRGRGLGRGSRRSPLDQSVFPGVPASVGPAVVLSSYEKSGGNRAGGLARDCGLVVLANLDHHGIRDRQHRYGRADIHRCDACCAEVLRAPGSRLRLDEFYMDGKLELYLSPELDVPRHGRAGCARIGGRGPSSVEARPPGGAPQLATGELRPRYRLFSTPDFFPLVLPRTVWLVRLL